MKESEDQTWRTVFWEHEEHRHVRGISFGNMRIDSFEKHMKESEDQTWRTLFWEHEEHRHARGISFGNMRNTDMPEESLLGT
jgi:hypothetical protein